MLKVIYMHIMYNIIDSQNQAESRLTCKHVHPCRYMYMYMHHAWPVHGIMRKLNLVMVLSRGVLIHLYMCMQPAYSSYSK